MNMAEKVRVSRKALWEKRRRKKRILLLKRVALGTLGGVALIASAVAINKHRV